MVRRHTQHTAGNRPVKLCERCGQRPPAQLDIWCKYCNLRVYYITLTVASGIVLGVAAFFASC